MSGTDSEAFRPGVLYAAQKLLDLVRSRPELTRSDLLKQFPVRGQVSTESLVEVSIRGRWLQESHSRRLAVTPAGVEVSRQGLVGGLRLQMLDLARVSSEH